jgi:hypothetical protein
VNEFKLFNIRTKILIGLLTMMGVYTTPAWGQRAIISFDGVKIYALPLEDEAPTTVLSKGDTVRIIGQRGEWVKIGYQDGRKGWMKIEVKREPAMNAKNSKKSESEISPGLAETNGVNVTATNSAEEPPPDRISKSTPDKMVFSGQRVYRRFGYSFGMGLIETDYTYNWKFVFHSTPRLALEGSFRHVLGGAADSYFIMANLSYLLKEKQKLLPYLTGGVGVINTVPDRSIGADGVSHMAINVGLGARKFLKEKLAVTFNANQYTAFVGKGIRHYREVTIGMLVGKFWD